MAAIESSNIEDDTECEVCHELDLTGEREVNCSLSELEVSAHKCNSCRVIHKVAKVKLGDEPQDQDIRICVYEHSISNFVCADTALISS